MPHSPPRSMRSGARLVALAGFMRILSAEFVQRFEGRLLNIHPSLLPKYKGLDTHARALAAGDSHHGASVHYVTAELDGGPVIMQGRLRIRAGDTPDAVSARVHTLEHIIYPHVCSLIAAGRIECRAGSVFSTARPSPRHSSRKTMRLPELALRLVLLAAAGTASADPDRPETVSRHLHRRMERHDRGELDGRAETRRPRHLHLFIGEFRARHFPHGVSRRADADQHLQDRRRPRRAADVRGHGRKGAPDQSHVRLAEETRHRRRQGQARRSRAARGRAGRDVAADRLAAQSRERQPCRARSG